MKVNGVAIYDTTASPFKRLPWGRCTKKLTADGATLYLHVFDWPADGRLLVPVANAVKRASLLADRGAALKVEKAKGGQVVLVPAAAPDADASVVVVEIDGAPEVIAE
jgi:alpha-L-fucosidase